MPETPMPATQYDLDVARNAEKARALKQLGYFALMSLGTGAAFRSATGLSDLFSRDRKNEQLREKVKALQPSTLRVPYPVYEEDPVLKIYNPEASKMKGLQGRLKVANPMSTTPPVPPIVGKTPGAEPRPGGWLLGDDHDSARNMPWFLPAAVLTGIGGIGGGYKLIDWIANRRRKREMEDDLNQAREEYRMALLDPHVQHMKESSFASDLDRLASILEKRGGWEEFKTSLNNFMGSGTGAYLTLASLLAGGSGYLAYQHGLSKSPQKMMSERIKKDLETQWAAHPPDVYAVPVPIRLRRRADKQMAQAEDSAIHDLQLKAASFLTKYAAIVGD